MNLTISVIFHSLLVGTVLYFAAREGIMGKKMATIVATLEKREKKPAPPPKAKEPEVKPETPKTVEVARPAAATAPVHTAAAPPPVAEPAAVAPAALILPDMNFDDGAHEVQTAADAKAAYKGMVERALRSRWNRPDDVADDTFVAEVELRIDSTGQFGGYEWLKGSGDARWDASVKATLAATKGMSRPPPKGFPEKFLVRFDVEAGRSEEVMTLSSR